LHCLNSVGGLCINSAEALLDLDVPEGGGQVIEGPQRPVLPEAGENGPELVEDGGGR
jgi:hypothetical protein